MKIYTSYFAKAAILRKAGIVPIGVALWPPRFFRGISMKQVAPRRYMLDDRLPAEEYIRMYRNDVIRLVAARSFIQDLERASRGMDVALCCFEKPGDFCHRHILAKWLNEQTGIEVSEFGVAESRQETLKPEQQSLF